MSSGLSELGRVQPPYGRDPSAQSPRQEAELGPPHAGDPARPQQTPAGRSPGPRGRRAPDRVDPSRYAGPTGPFPRVGPARADPDPAGDGRPGPEHDLAPDRLGRHLAATAQYGGLP